MTPIRKPGSVLLRLPDLPPLQCELRWSNACDAGVAFTVVLSEVALDHWIRSRLTVVVRTSGDGTRDGKLPAHSADSAVFAPVSWRTL